MTPLPSLLHVQSSSHTVFLHQCTNGSCETGSSFVSSKVTMSKNNPFLWGNGTNKVSSSVITLEYSTSRGKGISVNGLDKDFVLKIPNEAPPRPNTTAHLFITPDTDCVNHKIFVGKNDTAFELEFKLTQDKYTKVYVRFEKRAHKIKHDYSYYHPDLSSCVEPPERDNCTGVEDFMKCMGIPLNGTSNTNNLNKNSSHCQNTPDVHFLANSNLPRKNSTCLEYHEIASCPPCPRNESRNVSGNTTLGVNTTFILANFTGRPDCVNTTHFVCPKVQEFLECQNLTVKKYQECKPLLHRKKLIYNKYEKCHRNIWRHFVGIDIFNTSGWYYVAMCYNSEPLLPPTTIPLTTTASVTTTSAPTTSAPTTSAPTTSAPKTSANTVKPTTKKSWIRATWPKRSRKKRSVRSFDYEDLEYKDLFGDSQSKEFIQVHEMQDDFESLATIKHRSRRATSQRKCAVVEEKPPPTLVPPPPTEFPPTKPQVYNASTSLNYTFDSNLFTCLYWNETLDIWDTNGCRVCTIAINITWPRGYIENITWKI